MQNLWEIDLKNQVGEWFLENISELRLMPVWYKFRDFVFDGETYDVETTKKLHTNYISRLAQDLAYGTIDEFFHNIQIAILWLNSQSCK